eukprot:CAMPEP_0116142860 /NCGR_PEP_ID=MMETSP0329-20121206/15134_1 /TAXON_ID=697910 /ORGANISM="Pseudo-nitzschia arenysensis, Strain B593" /LENGTH=527 /DNA_ID=CAMNT_0003638125 /DNA_START=162 /DNA_END=1742 /DNA_ORIENTATION=+
MTVQQRQQDGFHDEDDDVPVANSLDVMKTKQLDWKSQVLAGFTSLKNSPPELYKVYALKFLDSYSYFSFSIIFTLFLSDEFGYSDIQAGTIYGAWGAMITVYGFCTGFLVDNFGVSKSLKLGYGLSLLARCGIFWTTSRTMLLVHIYGTLPMGSCLGIPVLMTGIRRYTHEQNRGFAFGIFYVVMNVAALISGPVVDILTIWYKGGDEDAGDDTVQMEDSGIKPWSLSSYRAIILSGIVSNAIACLISFTVREIKVEDPAKNKADNNNTIDEDETNGHPTDDSQSPRASDGVSVFKPKTGTPWKILSEIWKSPSFRRYLLVVLIMLNVRQIFRHLDATWPKYMVREFGPDVPKGTLYSINPILIIVLVPIVSAVTAHIDPLVMIHVGSYVSAASVFFLAVSTTIWSSCVFMVLLSVGEAIWSPRLNDYTVSVSEEGREGTYMALSSAPLFLAKLPVGILSGVLLQKYCPETLEEGEERHSRMMWLIVGLLTATSPVFLTCCWGYVSKKEPKDEFGDGVSYMELRKTA